jgi:ArsR family metal-binding transcriptional regulator
MIHGANPVQHNPKRAIMTVATLKADILAQIRPLLPKVKTYTSIRLLYCDEIRYFYPDGRVEMVPVKNPGLNFDRLEDMPVEALEQLLKELLSGKYVGTDRQG